MKAPYVKQHIQKDKWQFKCPYEMKPLYITIHNTYNKASAQNEVSYMESHNKPISCHIFVDDKEAIEAIPLNRNAWHCGDGGKGKGNRYSIGIEICYSTDYATNRHEKSFYNAVEVVKKIMKEFNIPIQNVVQHNHWSGKNCPHRIRAEGTWNKFIKLCKEPEKQIQDSVQNYIISFDCGNVTEMEAREKLQYICDCTGWNPNWFKIERVG